MRGGKEMRLVALAPLVVVVSYLWAKTNSELTDGGAICSRITGYTYIAKREVESNEGQRTEEYYIATLYTQEFVCCYGYFQPDKSAAECIPIIQINHSTPDPSSLILSWNPQDPSYADEIISGYIVVITELETSNSSFFNTSTNSFSISSLHPFYTYNCSVSAYTVGLGPYSPPYMVKMPQSIPTSPPLNLSLVASTSTSITLSWAPPPTQYQNGVITEYTLQIFNSQQSLLRETNTSSNRSTVDSLQPYTVYLFRVAAMTAIGKGPYSNSISATTSPSVPLIFPNVSSFLRLSADTILLSWQPMPPNTTQGALTGYSVRYRPIVAVVKRDINQGYTTISTTQTQITISSLDPTSAYMVGVAAVTQAGIGVYSENSVGLYENSLFQVYMQAPGIVCKEWMSYGTSEKMKDIIHRISSDLGSAFPIAYIGDTTLVCDKQHLNWVILTGRAVGTMKLNSSGMVYQLQEWVLSSPKVTSQGVVLQIMEYCPVYLKQLTSPSCSVAIATTPSPTFPVVPSIAISVCTGIGVLLVLTLAVMAIILYIRRKTGTTLNVKRGTLKVKHFDYTLRGPDAHVEENQYASIDNVTPYMGNSQRTDEPRSLAQGPVITEVRAIGCGLACSTAQTNLPYNISSERPTEGTDAGCEDHEGRDAECEDCDGPEDYVEMSSGGSVRDSIYQGSNQNTMQQECSQL